MPTDVAERAYKTRNSGTEQLRQYRIGTWLPASGTAYTRREPSRGAHAFLAAPAQSPTGSEIGRRIVGYVERYLTRNLELASSPPTPAGVSSSPLARAATMGAWDAKKRRRTRLINKKYSQGLDAKETAELSRLKSDVAAHMEIIVPRTGDLLDEQALRLQRLKQKKALAKKGKHG